MGPAEILESAVRALPEPEQDNLRYHVAAGTRVLAGPENQLWEGGGAGTPWALAGSRRVGERDVWLFAGVEDLHPGAVLALRVMELAVRATGSSESIIGVLDRLTEDEAAAAVERGLR